MRCFRARKWISAYIDQELDPGRRQALETHLADCQTCRAELDKTRKQWEALAGLDQAPPVPSGLFAGIIEALDEAERTCWHRPHRVRLLLVACIAVCFAIGFAGGAWLSSRVSPARDDAPGAAPLAERMLVAEAFDTHALGFSTEKEGLLRCIPR